MFIGLYFCLSLLSAFLLFWVQPMAAKAALPVLGGAPFVWNGCMVFFQAVLLLGYLYAHLLSRAVTVKRQPWFHIPLLLLALPAFPLSFAVHTAFDPATQPVGWLLGMLSLSVGAPFFVLSATSPLVQRWFGASNHPLARHPYFLYSASNAGSFAGLLAYPLLIEPFLTLQEQARLLQYGFIAALGLFTLAAFFLMRGSRTPGPAQDPPEDAAPTRGRKAQWLFLSFVSSSLLYGVTAYIVTDIASVPLFWVIPLALYLLTFVLAFARRPPALTHWRTLHMLGAPLMALMALWPQAFPAKVLLLHLAVFFAAALMCNGRLSQLKPAPSRLTAFYLWLSLGGVLGGIFNTFIAPELFNTIAEYPLMLLISVAAVSCTFATARPAFAYGVKTAAAWAIALAAFWLVTGHVPRIPLLSLFVAGELLLVLSAYFALKNRPLHYLTLLAPALLVTTPLYTHINGETVALTARNIFGVSRVVWLAGDQAWQFRHGTTNHGIQPAAGADRLAPTSYYSQMEDIYGALPERLKTAPVAVVGLGIGTVACYGHPRQDYDFFEINPQVKMIAGDTRYFTYLRDCPPQKHIVIGDGRISLRRSGDHHYGLIILDAFSSDAIPMHILTREAVAMYARKLQPGGMMAVHISNRHIDLLPVLAAIAGDTGLAGAWRLGVPPARLRLADTSEWVLLAPDASTLARLGPAWQKLPAADPRFLWRDDYSNILRSIRF